jgi:hypothetical protein
MQETNKLTDSPRSQLMMSNVAEDSLVISSLVQGRATLTNMHVRGDMGLDVDKLNRQNSHVHF